MRRTNDCWDSKTFKQISVYSSQMLWRFIQPNAQESETEEVLLNLSGLSKSDFENLIDIRILLSDETKLLINKIAPRVITHLSKESVNEIITERGRVRGRINWQRTFSSRAAAGNDISLYAYSRNSQVFDLPENRLFLYIIKRINAKAQKFASVDYQTLTWYTDIENGRKWVGRISVIASRTTKILRNPYAARIGNLYEITDRIIELTKKCRQVHYRELAGIAERFKFAQTMPVSYLRQELDNNILEPLNPDTLFEIAVLFKTIETALECGWTEKRAGLIGGSSKVISALKKNNSEMHIYYQKLPIQVAEISSYGNIMADYGLSEKLRRPDIIIELLNGERKNFIIVEVKRSKNRNYLVDGTYKLLGYLKDFEKINNENTSIRGFLVGWSGIKSLGYMSAKEVHLFNWGNYAQGLQEMLLNEY